MCTLHDDALNCNTPMRHTGRNIQCMVGESEVLTELLKASTPGFVSL